MPPPVGAADRLSRRSRLRRLELLLETFRPGPATTVLDVGAADAGYGEGGGFAAGNFLEEFSPRPERIAAVGLGAGAVFKERYPATRYVEADGCDLPFADAESDLYFSNAVVEHLASHEQQRAFVKEALRVARGVFLARPNRWFPLEVHTRLPLVHWLPGGRAPAPCGSSGPETARSYARPGRAICGSSFHPRRPFESSTTAWPSSRSPSRQRPCGPIAPDKPAA